VFVELQPTKLLDIRKDKENCNYH